MSHMRMQILNAMAAAVTGLATTGSNVWVGRVTALQRTEVPGLILRCMNERVEANSLGRPRIQERHLQVDVVAHVRETDEYETQLNQIFLEVEKALAAGAVPGSVGAKWVTLRNIDPPQREQNEVTFVQAALNFEVLYVIADSAPDVAL